jgi:hypothetical protein
MNETNNNINKLHSSSMADSDGAVALSVQPTHTTEKKGVIETVVPAAAITGNPTEPITGVGEHHGPDGEKIATPNRDSAISADAVDEEDDFEYPTKWKLAVITLALCLSVFCMALVSCSTFKLWYPQLLRQRRHCVKPI